MYMRRLVEFAEQHDNDLPPIGYARKSYQWTAVITNDDQFEFFPAGRDDQRIIPDRSRSSGVSPILLTDKAEYVLQLSKNPSDAKAEARAAECHRAYLKLLNECSEATQNDVIKKIVHILECKNWRMQEGMKPEDIILFRAETDYFPHEAKEVKEFWATAILNANLKGGVDRVCFICGRSAPAVKRHSITFALGKDRAKLISANDSAYFSYGLENSEISPTCFVCEQKYGQALSFLLQKYASKDRRGGPNMIQVGDVTYVYWARQNESELASALSLLATPDPEAVRRIVESPFRGTENHSNLHRVSILSLSANKARLVVREYMEPPVWQVKNQIGRFFRAQQVTGARPSSIYLLAACMYRDGNKEIQKHDIEDWMNWALFGRRISERIASKILRRIQAGGAMTWIQAAAIKSWLISQNKGEWTMDLDNARITPPYLCGRLFAVLEAVQYEAVRGNETIASRYYSAASTTPRSIFGLLIRNSKWHLSKIGKVEKGYEIRYQQRIQLISEQLYEFPTVLGLHEQAEFALGYYHERQEIYKKKTDASVVDDLKNTNKDAIKEEKDNESESNY
ncbi:type I-C CRISPR-associated protein Cas8c/Csd1 [Paenibacillaceae bacterium]|nr:type I-C CRISPR-associated protein Cas8c/Csd1 [Paenibacillaceae bacterium]